MISNRQKIIVVLIVVLAVLLYFAPKTPNESKEKIQEEVIANNEDFAASFQEALKKATSEQKGLFNRIQEGLIKAQRENTEKSWMTSSDDFLRGARFIQDDNKATLYKGAINGYRKVLELNPNNLSAKTNLGTAMVESASLLGKQPMEGISLLREVIQKDSNNIEAILQLGLFSITSQQYSKAIERFNQILRIDSSKIYMYVYLGDTYIAMGDKLNAINNYEKYKSQVKDTLVKKDIEEYIKKLKQ